MSSRDVRIVCPRPYSYIYSVGMPVTDGGKRNLGSVRWLCIATAYQVDSGRHSLAEVYHSVYYSLPKIRHTHLTGAEKKWGVNLRGREFHEMFNI